MAPVFSSYLLLIAQLLHAAVAGPIEQHVLNSAQAPKGPDIIHEYALSISTLMYLDLTPIRLRRAEIIPTVIDAFTPKFSMNLTWPSANVSTSLGNTLEPGDMQHVPDIIVYDATPSALKPVKSMQYTVILTDPDAPSRDNPEWSEMCHWIATGYPGQPKWTEHVHYKPPGPPPKTGKHRYVFLLLAPANGTTEELHLQKPADRKHWGFEHERDGVRKWAQGQGLVVVGANFIYSQNDKQ